jgi:hypothetical protein
MEDIYVILNDSMPDRMKIGCGDSNKRLEEANTYAKTWMPTPYYIYLKKTGFKKGHHELTEKGIHRILDDIRIKPERGSGFGTEWFNKDLARVKLLFDAAAGEYVENAITIKNKIVEFVLPTKEERQELYRKLNISCWNEYKLKKTEDMPDDLKIYPDYLNPDDEFEIVEDGSTY